MPETPDKPEAHEVPKSFWEKVKEKPWTYIGIAASIVIPLIVGSWLLIQSGGGFTSYPEDEEAVEESRGAEIPESTETSEGLSATETVPADDSETDGSNDGTADEQQLAPVIAYRQGGALYVAAEDGSAPQAVATSERGAFALSPDGKTLAWVDDATGMLHVTKVGGADVEAGKAENVAPSWAADSSWLAYTAPGAAGTAVHRVEADGSGMVMLAAGHTPRVAADSSSIAYITSAAPGAPGGIEVVSAAGQPEGAIVGAMAIEAVPVGDEIVYSVTGGKDGEEIKASAFDGTDTRTFVGPARLGVPVVYSRLLPSPDGSELKYAASGDDGYSRAYVVELTGEPTPLSLSIRRDTYPLRWGSDGERLFIVEGNAFQGEKTTVIGVSGDGLGRTVIVEGGGL